MHKKQEETICKKIKRNGIKATKKIGKATYEVIVHFNESAAETMQDKLRRIMLRETDTKATKKIIKMIKKSLTSSNKWNSLMPFLPQLKLFAPI